jgi:cytochrome c551
MNLPLMMFLSLFSSFIILLVGCNEKDNISPSNLKVSEKESFRNHCANCHGGNLEGGFGPSLQHIGSKYKKEEISQIIQHGKGNMPSQNYILKDEQQKLAAWLSNKK